VNSHDVIANEWADGFIGLVAAITIQFGISSLTNWQTWLIFAVSFVLVWWFKRSAGWAIIGIFALLFIGA